MTALASSSYGKSAVRLVKVVRRGGRHEIRDLTVDMALEGDFEAAHSAGDNSRVLPTDTMKNTVYAKAREMPVGECEEFAMLLADHLLDAAPAATTVHVNVAEHEWQRIETEERPHDHAFVRGAEDVRIAHVSLTRGQTPTITAGIEGLVVLKSARSAFTGYPRDRYTTLAETDDRILATSISTRWRYGAGASSFGTLWTAIRQVLLKTFADHDSRSVQHTLYAMASAVLEECGDVDEIRITMPNKHHLLVDLAPFGLTNPNEIFVPTDEPYGLIEAIIRRERA